MDVASPAPQTRLLWRRLACGRRCVGLGRVDRPFNPGHGLFVMFAVPIISDIACRIYGNVSPYVLLGRGDLPPNHGPADAACPRQRLTDQRLEASQQSRSCETFDLISRKNRVQRVKRREAWGHDRRKKSTGRKEPTCRPAGTTLVEPAADRHAAAQRQGAGPCRLGRRL